MNKNIMKSNSDNEIKEYISRYFFIAQDVVKKYNPDVVVILQFFQKKDFAMLAGIQEALCFLKTHISDKDVKVRYLEDGSFVKCREVVLELEGKYQDFGIYEGIIDGILSRSTSIATNSFLCLKAANNKEVICMSDRSDHYVNQKRDGEAMYVAGIRSFSSDIQSPNSACKVYGSIPHALIQNFLGDVVKPMEYYQQLFPEDDLVGLVDFNNDVIADSIKLWNHFKDDLKGVRVDTSELMQDVMFDKDIECTSTWKNGVNPTQIKRLRKSLDDVGANNVKIFISSGLNPEKISMFEKENTPVDGYGVGECLLKINITFCGDVTMINNTPCAKVGRQYTNNPKLKEHRWK